jgi:hypothetical protein
MMARGKDPAALIGLAVETIRVELQPVLSPEKRYAAAMAANALEIAMRAVAVEDEAIDLELLDAFYEDGDGTMRQLARDIRSGKVSEASHPDLRRRLRAHLVAELKIRNPRFLASRGVKA